MKQPRLNGKLVKLVIGRGGSHWYQLGKDGHLWPSVTTITGAVLAKPMLVPWAKKVALENVRKVLLEVDFKKVACSIKTDRLSQEWVDGVIETAKKLPQQIADEAAEIGTRAHQAIDQMLKGLIPMTLEHVHEDIHKPVQGFLDWYPTSGIKITGSELRVASQKLGVGGSMDSMGQDNDGNNVICDWKTGRSIHSEASYQVGGYALCYEEMTGEQVNRALILRVAKLADDPVPFEVKWVKDMNLAKSGFAMCKAIYDINKADILGLKPVAKKEKIA